ncbi:MAG: histidine--tRNA ligase [bacterium]|nr:histidine--tRNA ligase [bacterium]
MPKKKKNDADDEPSIVPVSPTIQLQTMSKTPQLIKGMKDVLPIDQAMWEHIRDTARMIATQYGFERIDTPILEPTSLYTHSVGKLTDIVEKEMYTFTDLGGDSVTMRPEFTAGVARAYIEHGMWNMPQPIKMYSIGSLFRHEKPQADRYRQHNQFDCEVIGESNPAVDAQLILIAYKLYKTLSIPVMLQINSIGCLVCRGVYKEELTEYYKSKRSHVCEDCKRRLTKNPLRLLDCKVEQCQPIKNGAPQIVDYLCDECKTHFEKVLEFLDVLEIPYSLNSYLVRGFDYYTRTVFEFYLLQEEEEVPGLALGGGGRYDNLIEVLGGRPTPGCGFGLGIERIVNRLKQMIHDGDESVLPVRAPVDIFFAQLGEQAKRQSMVLYENLVSEEFAVAEGFAKDSLKAQLELANKLNVRFTLILGQKELLDGTIIIRNMEGGEQEVVDIKKIVPILKKKMESVSEDPQSNL